MQAQVMKETKQVTSEQNFEGVKKNRLAIILFSGTIDKIMPIGTLASAAVALGMDVDIFATFWGLNALRKDVINSNRKFSKEYEDMAELMMKQMQKHKVPSWYETLKEAKELGNVKIHACSQTFALLDMKKEDLDPIVDDVVGAGTFLLLARDSKVTLFI